MTVTVPQEDDDMGEISYTIPVHRSKLSSNGTWIVDVKDKSPSSVSSVPLSNENFYFLICFYMAYGLNFLFAF